MIRKALPNDAEAIAICLLFAMEKIVYKLIGQRNFDEALAFMRYFVESENNQYSWQNCWVAESDGRIVAAVNVYDGAKLQQLRQPVIEYLQNTLNRHIIPEDETHAGEFYIDSLGVHPDHRCKGIATNLIKALINEYVSGRGLSLGLLVDDDNPKAKKLYTRLGFQTIGRTRLLGKQLGHLQISPSEMS